MSHLPGIDRIVEAATAINPKIYLVLGGFHMVTATDEAIAKTVSTLKDVYKISNIAPGHCTASRPSRLCKGRLDLITSMPA